ncbi:winged helix-turn-helix domain-containing protein [Pseudoalteromonas umbrosa]|uniref:winged helix-turn-helix domain-containing protein n=1 Tax=Pseudoalteromonas umbrosa TaxID=3048489 RepID=UPI0024C3CD43|nr:winged helix-turn-helix domain-containing protein [Pseudoalteromonas sp. B95]MDK1289309.1 winged helix-turn-helix domain-containing protein [Pseudoalteromonas sp. B95]
MHTVLIAESKSNSLAVPQAALQDQGFDVQTMVLENLDHVNQKSRKGMVTSIVIDQTIATSAKFDTINTLKSYYQVPVLVSVEDNNDDIQSLLLELGADDVIATHAKPRLWRARLDAMLRKYKLFKLQHNCINGKDLSFGELTIKGEERTVLLGDQRVSLTTHEFDLIWLLASKAPKVVSREEIYEKIIGQDYQANSRTIDVRVSCLRKKLGDNATSPQKIKTVWRQGYLFVKEAW